MSVIIGQALHVMSVQPLRWERENPLEKAAVISQHPLQGNNLTSSIGLDAEGWGETDLVSWAGDAVGVTVY